MATVTKGKTFISGETVEPADMHQLVDSATVTNIAVADLAAATVERLLPAGAVMPFAMNSAPSGWLAANGDAVSRSTYSALFAAIGTTYGAGDGSTTFTLPDMRGYFVRGSGTNGDGVAAGTFGAKQADAFESHEHALMSNNTSSQVLSSTRRYMALVGDQGANSFSYAVLGTSGLPNSAATGLTGGTETRPANIALLYCIKF
jgi:microcystin-dependent protein